MAFGYAREKAAQTLHTMAVSPKPLGERIAYAIMYGITHVDPDRDELPDDLAASYADIMERCTAREAEGNEGTLLATLPHMDGDELDQIAADLYEWCRDTMTRQLA